MLSFDDYRETDTTVGSSHPKYGPGLTPAASPTSSAQSPFDLSALEDFLIKSIEMQLDGLKRQSILQVRANMKNNQGFTTKVKNWWSNWVNGTTGESVENQAISLSPYADDILLSELQTIMEGPVDQAVSQISSLIDRMKVQLVATIRDGFKRVQVMPPAPKPKQFTADDFPTMSTNTGRSPGGTPDDVSRTHTGMPSWDPYATTTHTHADRSPESMPQPEPTKTPLSPGMRRGVGMTDVVADHPGEEVPVEAPKAAPVRRRLMKKPRVHIRDIDSLPPEETEMHIKALQKIGGLELGKDLVALYEKQPKAEQKREMINFLLHIHENEMRPLFDSGTVPQIITWLRHFDPSGWETLGKRLKVNPHIIGSEHGFIKWAKKQPGVKLREGIRYRSAMLVELLRQQRQAN